MSSTASEPCFAASRCPLPLARTDYQRGDTVIAEFWSASPTVHYTTGNNYLLVERKTEAGWRVENDSYVAELSWEIPVAGSAGDYRIRHFGYDRNGVAFGDVSELFRISP